MCPFCELPPDRAWVLENEWAVALWDKFPVAPGHALLIPRRHVADYFELSPEERTACWDLAARMKAKIDELHEPDGYNLGINCGEWAGQTVFHVHIHLIPRYKGDVMNPRGGVRNVIPGKGDY